MSHGDGGSVTFDTGTKNEWSHGDEKCEEIGDRKMAGKTVRENDKEN